MAAPRGAARAAALLITLSIVLHSSVLAAESRKARDFRHYSAAMASSRPVAHASGTRDLTSKSQSDSFYLYGGPGSVLGGFQTLSVGGVPDAQGWTSVDLTDDGSHWRASSTNAAPFVTAGPNYAVICHHDGPDYQGYGNLWNDWLVFDLDVGMLGIDPILDPSSVRLQFEFVHDSEPFSDWFTVEAVTGTGIIELGKVSGSSYDSGGGVYNVVSFDETISYVPGMYLDGMVRLRLRFRSDYAWSDEDGIASTAGRGAVAVDNIFVSLNSIPISIATWDDLGGGCGDCPEGDISGHDNGFAPATEGWHPVAAQFVGDFAKLFTGMQALDQCRSNASPQFSFIDDGTPPNNAIASETTGGALSGSWGYGVPGGWVVNYNGGLSNGDLSLQNEIWSPVFDWDLAGPADDIANGGALLRFDALSHLPLDNGIFYTWHVRSFTTAAGWTPWRSHGYVYYGLATEYFTHEVDVSTLLLTGPEQVQIALGVADLAGQFGLLGVDATPAPWLDNVSFVKYVLGGPVLSADEPHLFNDGFPTSGNITYTETTASNLYVRLDMARDIAPAGGAIVPGDSMVIDAVAVIPGTNLVAPPQMHWMLEANPAFTVERTGGIIAAGATAIGGNRWVGIVGGQPVTSGGGPVADRYWFDLPDGPANVAASYQTPEDPLFFPGDRLRFFFEAQDNLGNITTLPADTTGYSFPGYVLAKRSGSICPKHSLTTYDPHYRTGALPGLWVKFQASPKLAPDQPSPAKTIEAIESPKILVWNDYGLDAGRDLIYDLAMYQNGLTESAGFDMYTTKAADSGVSNGLGSSGGHGANAAQLAGYDCILYLSGDREAFLISDGSELSGNDKSDDLGVLSSWLAQTADRGAAFFGNNIGSAHVNQGAATLAFVNGTLGVNVISDDVRPVIDGQTSPLVVPTGNVPTFLTDFIADGSCSPIRKFDQLEPLGVDPISAHEFTDISGNPYFIEVPASVWWQRFVGLDQKTTLAVAVDPRFMRDPTHPALGGSGASARAKLIGEALISFGHVLDGIPTPNPATPTVRLALQSIHPNPFNPATTIRFEAPARGRVQIHVYNLRGARVTTLLDAELAAGPGEIRWTGTDARGTRVSSGIYVVELRGFGQVETRKVALVK